MPETKHSSFTLKVTVNGNQPPQIVTTIPGTQSLELVDQLAQSECPALTQRRARRAETNGILQDPIVWASAQGSNVVDVDGNRYVDLVGGFGVCLLGHNHPKISETIARQSNRLIHGFGDYQPSESKIALLQKLQDISPIPDSRVILGLSGADSVEASLKTAVLHSKKRGFIAFKGGYHGLSWGTLPICGYSESFRKPFVDPCHLIDFPQTTSGVTSCFKEIDAICHEQEVGALIVEPIQGRGGIRIPPSGFLKELHKHCKKNKILCIADEVLTGLGRTGNHYWRCTTEEVQPDILVIGKGLGGGLPISACIIRSEIAQAWGQPAQIPIHTSTFNGSPLTCAVALQNLELIEHENILSKVKKIGEPWLEQLNHIGGNEFKARGAGLLIGLEFESTKRCLEIIAKLLQQGFITLPAGEKGNIIQLSPSAHIDESLLALFNKALQSSLTM